MKENRKTVEKINNVESWFFEKTSKTDKTLSRLTKKKSLKLLRSQIKLRTLLLTLELFLKGL